MSQALASPVFAVALTLVVFHLANRLYQRRRFFLLNPVLISIVAIMAVLYALGIDYQTYNKGGRLITFLLGPAVVALGVLLHEQLTAIRSLAGPMLITILAGSLVGIVSAAACAMWLGAPPQAVASIAPKSVTTPIAMGIAQKLGGIPSLTAALVIAAGVMGAALGPPFLRLLGVKSPTAFGLAMGSAAHGIGTARALEEGVLEGAVSGLAICLNGLATAILAPMVLLVLRALFN